MPISILRMIRSLAMLIALSAGSDIGEAQASAKVDPSLLETTSIELEQRIRKLIDRWFAILEDPTIEAETLTSLVAESPFELILDGEALIDRDELFAWASNLRATYSQIEYQLSPIRIHSEGRGRYLVRFEFDRRALDQAGFPHVTRRDQTWLVLSDANATPVILRIEEQPLLFFPGTGPQIICY